MATRTERVVADGRTFSYVLHDAGDTQLTITQNDVRAIQLAKAALRAGIDLLVEHAGSPDGHRHPPGRRVRRPHRPASTRWCSVSCPTVRSTACARSATPPAPAPCRRCCRGGCGPRWRPPCAGVDQDRDRHRAAVPGAVRRGDGASRTPRARRRTWRPWSTSRAAERRATPSARRARAGTDPASDGSDDVPTDVMEDAS